MTRPELHKLALHHANRLGGSIREVCSAQLPIGPSPEHIHSLGYAIDFPTPAAWLTHYVWVEMELAEAEALLDTKFRAVTAKWPPSTATVVEWPRVMELTTGPTLQPFLAWAPHVTGRAWFISATSIGQAYEALVAAGLLGVEVHTVWMKALGKGADTQRTTEFSVVHHPAPRKPAPWEY